MEIIFTDSLELLIISIDIETSGYVSEKHYIKAIGAVSLDNCGKQVSIFSVSLTTPPGCVMEEECKREFWDKNPGLYEKLSENEVDYKKGTQEFLNWIESQYALGYQRVKIVTDFPEFDIAFINLYLTKYLDKKPLYYYSDTYVGGAMCIDDFVRGMLHIPFEWNTNKYLNEQCTKHELIPPKKGDHNPINDAIEIGMNAANAFIISERLKTKENLTEFLNEETKDFIFENE